MATLKELKYSKEHEWARVEGDTVYVGITDFAQEQLGDIVFVDLPNVGRQIAREEAFGAVESTKSVSDCYSPVSGTIVEVNTALTDAPETINEEPYSDGWLVRIKLEDPGELDDLMSADEYEAFLKDQEHE